MDTAPEVEDADPEDEPSTERLLEALMVDDAEVVWDPATGRAKIVLDRPADPA